MIHLFTSEPDLPPHHSPRGITFFASRMAKPLGDGRYAGGLYEDSHGIHLYDPWGEWYYIEVAPDLSGVRVNSSGPDRIYGTKDDISED